MIVGSRRGALLLSSALVGLAMLGFGSTVRAADQTYQFDIPAESLGQALTDFSRASSQQIVFSEDVAAGKSTKGLHGRYTAVEALDVLLAGTGLQMETNSSGVMMVRSKNAQAASSEGAANTETVIVTGTRLKDAPKQTAQEMRSYDRSQIEASGQPSITGFLNTLPEVSQNALPPNLISSAVSTVQLRGFPVGTTLVLLDGSRAPTTGYGSETGSSFDVSNIPEDLIQRVDILPLGSSAIYGSDALAGVVNFVLRRDLDGLEGTFAESHAEDYDKYRITASYGQKFDKGDFGFGISYQTNNLVSLNDRPNIGDGDFSKFASRGGQDMAWPYTCSPGTVRTASGANLPGLSSPVAGISANSTGVPSVSSFSPSVTNLCGEFAQSALVPGSSRLSGIAYGDWDITSHLHAYSTVLFGHLENRTQLFGVVLFDSTIPATNPYNPFGVPVVVDGSYGVSTAKLATDFLHAEAGLRGDLSASWTWELDGHLTQDADSDTQNNRVAYLPFFAALSSSDPVTAFNPFDVDAENSAAAHAFLRTTRSTFYDKDASIQFVAQGPLFDLPGGPLQVVVGGAYEYQDFYNSTIGLDVTGASIPTTTTGTRGIESIFGELRAPVIGPLAGGSEPFATLTAAGRFDDFSDFGSAAKPQFGAELRPLDQLLFRASYSQAFRAPTLYAVHAAQQSFSAQVIDPQNGNISVVVPELVGGNPNLRPETGSSYSFGSVWTRPDLNDFTLSATYWNINENNRITTLDAQTVLDNPTLFPGFATRDGAGNLTGVKVIELNFGQLQAEGVDADASAKFETNFGIFSPTLSATVTTKFVAALLPGQPLVNRLGAATLEDAWAPAWKATAGLSWENAGYSANFTARYLGAYLDYQDIPNQNHLGNYFLFDASFRIKLGQALNRDEPGLDRSELAISAVNILNQGPQYSNFNYGTFGYDPSQFDLLGRIISIKLTTRW